MDQPTRQAVLDIIEHGHDLTLAPLRPDGFPQATTVSYAHDDMMIFVGVGKSSQKVNNIRYSNKVSLTINNDYQDWQHIKGLSMAAIAEILEDPQEIRHAANCLLQRFPQVEEWTQAERSADIVFLRIRPQIISVLDYQKGFGHTDLVSV